MVGGNENQRVVTVAIRNPRAGDADSLVEFNEFVNGAIGIHPVKFTVDGSSLQS